MGKILVTGGAGYIGSHTVVALIEQGHEVLIFDNFSNSSPIAVARVAEITGVQPTLVEGDLCDAAAVRALFVDQEIEAVVHFAGLKAVGESVQQPLRYYRENVTGAINLLEAMQQNHCRHLVFSSSCTVYGDPKSVPIQEHFPLGATNPYGHTKLVIEQMLRDLSAADDGWRIAILRYFNPVAAHKSGRIGEDPAGVPNNLLPYIAQVAVGRLERLAVFGDDYETVDGTGVRDYIHVVDLAEAHLAALNRLPELAGCRAFNVGTGEGYSVLQMLRAFEQASGREIPYVIESRRPGDIAICYADSSRCAEELGWQAKHGLDQMMRDQWRWQSNNPEGYV